VEGTRTTEDYTTLFNDIEKKRLFTSPIPVFTSDDWDAIEEGLVNVYGMVEQPLYKGVGRKPYPVLVPLGDLKYAQVCKKRQNGRVVEVIQRVVFGDPDKVLNLLGADSGGTINTAYIERMNLTFRNSLARFIRKTMNISKNMRMHSRAIDFFQAWYNFVKPHKSLRVLVIDGKRKWKQRTPAVAEGLADHIWTLEELVTFKVPVQ
jgi:hypothetical protein